MLHIAYFFCLNVFFSILFKIQQQKEIPAKTNYLGVDNWLAKKSELCAANTDINEIDLTSNESNDYENGCTKFKRDGTPNNDFE